MKNSNLKLKEKILSLKWQKNVLGKLSYYYLPLLMTIAFILIWILGEKTLLRSYSDELGNFGYYLLLFLMFASPISKITNCKFWKRIVLLRRELGVLSFYPLAIHTLGLMIYFRLFESGALGVIINDFGARMIYGFIGIFFMIILAATSNNYFLKKLKTKWKKVQMLAYVALLFSILHVAMAKNRLLDYFLLGSYLILKIIAVIKEKKNKKKN